MLDSEYPDDKAKTELDLDPEDASIEPWNNITSIENSKNHKYERNNNNSD